jgi:Homeodomain-like domain
MKTTPRIRLNIIALHVKHPEMTNTAIAKRYGISKSYLGRILKRYKPPKIPRVHGIALRKQIARQEKVRVLNGAAMVMAGG